MGIYGFLLVVIFVSLNVSVMGQLGHCLEGLSKVSIFGFLLVAFFVSVNLNVIAPAV